jgi:branched-chain amino acid transport system permease protein
MRQGAIAAYALHLAVIAGLFLLQYLLPAYHMGNLTRIMVYAVLAIGYNILFGYTGLMSLGHALFFASGAYGAGLAVHWLGFGPITALIAGIAAALLVSVLAGVVLLRVSGVAFLIVTLMLAQASFLATLYFNSITLGDQGIVLALPPVEIGGASFALSDPAVKYNAALVAFALVLLFSLWLLRSPFGRILIAVRENEARTRLLGYNTFLYRFWALVISGTISGLAGALYCLIFAYVGSSFASLQYSTLPLLYTLLGGTGVTLGPLVGTAIMYYLIDISSSFTSSYMIIVGAALLIVTLWFPEGLAGQWRRLFRRRAA